MKPSYSITDRPIYKGRRTLLFCSLALGVAAIGWGPESASQESEFVIDRFTHDVTAEGLPQGWESLTFKKIPRHTLYSVQKSSDNFFLKAESRSSASGLIKRIELDLKTYPILAWRWKVEQFIRSGDERRKDRDDYAARVYITFKYDPNSATLWEKITYGAYKTLYGEYPPKASLNYIWANKLPRGETLVSPYTDRSYMIAVRSGEDGLETWHSEERNVLSDYKTLFGKDPPPVQGIAIMTDTDNTEEDAVAYYDDLVFKKSP
jgi:hypothetical protein